MYIPNNTKEFIEMVAKHAWPAKVQQQYHQWILRANDGVTKRANSVYTIGNIPEDDNWLAEIELFYNEAHISPCFYITELSPSNLDRILSDRNYEKVASLSILSIESKQIIDQVEMDTNLRVELTPEVTSSWLSSFIKLEGHKWQDADAFQTIFQGIRLSKAFVSLHLADEVVAVATIATERGWGYISNVVVNTQFRRRGIATQLFLHLAKWALNNNAKTLFMQVLADNEPALHLYYKLGFEQIAKSHYRMKM